MIQKNTILITLSLAVIAMLSCQGGTSSNDARPDERIEQRNEGQIRIERDGSTEYRAQYKEAEQLLSKHKIDEAIKILTHLSEIEKQSSKPFALSGLAFAYNSKQAYAKALLCYEAAIKIDGKDAILYDGLASTYAQLKQYDSALVAYKTAVQLSRDDIDGNLGMALIYANIGKLDSAKIYARKTLDLKPDTEFRKEMQEILARK